MCVDLVSRLVSVGNVFGSTRNMDSILILGRQCIDGWPCTLEYENCDPRSLSSESQPMQAGLAWLGPDRLEYLQIFVLDVGTERCRGPVCCMSGTVSYHARLSNNMTLRRIARESYGVTLYGNSRIPHSGVWLDCQTSPIYQAVGKREPNDSSSVYSSSCPFLTCEADQCLALEVGQGKKISTETERSCQEQHVVDHRIDRLPVPLKSSIPGCILRAQHWIVLATSL